MAKNPKATKKFSIMVCATLTYTKEVEIVAADEASAKKMAIAQVREEDPTAGAGWSSDEPCRMKADDCEET